VAVEAQAVMALLLAQQAVLVEVRVKTQISPAGQEQQGKEILEAPPLVQPDLVRLVAAVQVWQVETV
jgi:hypothetical protein